MNATITGLGVKECDMCWLRLNVPATVSAEQKFTISGTANGEDQGSVDIMISPTAVVDPNRLPDPFLNAAPIWCAQSILLHDQGNNYIPIGQKLHFNTKYKFGVRIFNTASVPASKTVVRFWWFDGGNGTYGELLDCQTVDIPAAPHPGKLAPHPRMPGECVVWSNVDFPTPKFGGHRCAVVSISNPNAKDPDHRMDAPTCYDVPAPEDLDDGSWSPCGHTASAWRNTDSIWCMPYKKIDYEFGVPGLWIRGKLPLIVKCQVQKVPQDFNEKNPISRAISEGGLTAQCPVYLLDSVRTDLPTANLSIDLQPVDKNSPRIEKVKAAVPTFKLWPGKKNSNFRLEGQLPKDAKPGETYLVTVNAQHPAVDKRKPRLIGFVLIVNVGNQAK
jgi:hypothetical protein